MDLQQIEAFIYIARKGSFSKAAEKLYISQPTISERIRTLEKELGVDLFHRTRRQVQLTSQGKTFLPYAETSLNSLLEGKNIIQSERETYNLRIGIDQPFSSHTILSQMLRKLYKEFSDLNIHVYRKKSSADMIEWLKQSKIDLAFTNTQFKGDEFIKRTPLYQERLISLSNPAHPLSDLPSVNMTNVKQFKFVVLDQKNNISEILKEFLRSNQITLKTKIIEINSIVVIKELIRTEQMLALLPEYIVADEIRKGSLVEIPFPSLPQPLENSLLYTANFQRLDLLEFIQYEVKKSLIK